MPLTATGNLLVRVGYQSTYAGSGGTIADALDRTVRTNWGAGTGALQFDMAWSATGTLTSSSLTFVLSALAGPDGNPLAMARVKEFFLFNLADPSGSSANAITLSPGTTHPWAAGFVAGSPVARAGGWAGFCAPDAVGAVVASGSADQITITSAGTAGFLLAIKGASA